MFDPEKVIRLDFEGYDSYMSSNAEGDFVAWDDYVLLLALYREVKWKYDDLCK